MGLSWAHILGDAFSAFNFIIKWSQTLAGEAPPKSLHMPILSKPQIFLPNSVSDQNPFSIKRATIIGEYWLASNDSDVATHSFHITSKQLHHLVTNQTNIDTTKTNNKTSYFEVISALVWKCLAQIREELGPRVVTICTSVTNRAENEFPSNYGLLLSRIEADFPAGESDISELARLIGEKKLNENRVLEKLVEESEQGKEDYIVYGANLTFVDLEEADFYGVKMNGKKPIMANCSFRGVGDQGVVLVLPAPEDNDLGDGNGRIITVSLPAEKELDQLKDKLGREWGIHCSRPGF